MFIYMEYFSAAIKAECEKKTDKTAISDSQCIGYWTEIGFGGP